MQLTNVDGPVHALPHIAQFNSLSASIGDSAVFARSLPVEKNAFKDDWAISVTARLETAFAYLFAMNNLQSTLEGDKKKKAPVASRPSVWGTPSRSVDPGTPTSENMMSSSTISGEDCPVTPPGSDYDNAPVRKFSTGGTELSLMSLLLAMDSRSPKVQPKSYANIEDKSLSGDLDTANDQMAVLDPNMIKLLLESFGAGSLRKYTENNLELPVSVPPGFSAPTVASSEATPSEAEVTGASVLRPDDCTVMLRNVPYEAKQLGVLALLNEEGFNGSFTFFYSPLDFRSKNNLGYAFVNLRTSTEAKRFEQFFDGLRVRNRVGWDKPLRVGRARIQGLQANIDHYRNSPVNVMPDEFKPMIFCERTFERLPFPAPDAAPASPENKLRSAATTVRPRERRLQGQLVGVQSLRSGSSAAKLFVGGLSSETTSSGLWDYMSSFGRVLDAQVLLDPITGRSRTYGFCTFADVVSAANALEPKAGHYLDGRIIVVRKYTSTSAAHSSL